MHLALPILTAILAAPIDDRISQMERELEILRQQNESLSAGLDEMRRINKSLQSSVDQLQVQQNDKWLSQERAAEIQKTVEGVLKDAETRTSLKEATTLTGYHPDRGFFIATPDGNFKLNVGGQVQVRYAANFYSDNDVNILNANPGAGAVRGTAASSTPGAGGYKKSAYGFEVRRMKLDFFGHVVDPSWQYRVVLIYVQNQNAISTPGGNNNSGSAGSSTMGMEEAMVIKDLGDGMKLSIGQFKSPFLREEITSSRRQLAVERSLVDQMFSTKFTQGVQFGWRDEQLVLEAMVNDGGSNANTGAVSGFNNGTNVPVVPVGDQNNGVGMAQWAVTAHVGWMPFGDWKEFNDLNSHVGNKDGLLLEAWVNWQRGGGQSSSFTGANNIPLNGNSDGEFLTWSLDVAWNTSGANIFAYWVMNTAYSIPGSNTNNGPSINSYGAVVQGGWFVNDVVELYGRWEWLNTENVGVNVIPNSATTGSANVFNAGRSNIYTLGFNWFLGGQYVKLTTDMSWCSDPLWFTNGIYGAGIAGTDFRVEPVGGGDQVVFRSQLQLVF
jgi:hypothetical protein